MMMQTVRVLFLSMVAVSASWSTFATPMTPLHLAPHAGSTVDGFLEFHVDTEIQLAQAKRGVDKSKFKKTEPTKPTTTTPSASTPSASTPSAAAPAPVPVVGEKKYRLALLPLRAEGLQLNEAQRLDLAMRMKLEESGRFEVQSAVLTTKLLESAQGLGLECDINSVECARDIGQIADVAFIILGAAVVVDDRVGMDLRLIDVTNGTEVRRVSGLISRGATELVPAAARVMSRFLSDDGALAKATVRIVPDGATVTLNGVERGVSPLAVPIEGLLDGDHHLLITREGSLPHVTRFTLGPLEAAEIDITLVEEPKTIVEKESVSPIEIAIPFALAGGGALGIVGGGIAAGVGLYPLTEYTRLVGELNQETAEGNVQSEAFGVFAAQNYQQQKNAYDAWTGWGQVTTGIGAALAGVGVVVAAAGLSWGAYVLSVALSEPEAATPDAGAAE